MSSPVPYVQRGDQVTSYLVAEDRENELEVFRAALTQLLLRIDPGGFNTRGLGVRWTTPPTEHVVVAVREIRSDDPPGAGR